MGDTEKAFDFGDYAILTPIEYKFAKAPGKFWRFKPVTSGMELDRSMFLMHNRVTENVFGERVEAPPTTMEIVHRELALTFGGTNLTYTDGTPALEDDATLAEVEAFLRLMPPAMVRELWDAIGKHFEGWGPRKDPKAKKK